MKYDRGIINRASNAFVLQMPVFAKTERSDFTKIACWEVSQTLRNVLFRGRAVREKRRGDPPVMDKKNIIRLSVRMCLYLYR